MQQEFFFCFLVSVMGVLGFFGPMKYPLHALPNFNSYSKLTNFVTNTPVPFSLQTISHDQKFRLLFFFLNSYTFAGRKPKQTKQNKHRETLNLFCNQLKNTAQNT